MYLSRRVELKLSVEDGSLIVRLCENSAWTNFKEEVITEASIDLSELRGTGEQP